MTPHTDPPSPPLTLLEIPLRAGPALYPLTPTPNPHNLLLKSKDSYIILLHDISQFLRENFTMTQQEYSCLISPHPQNSHPKTPQMPTFNLLHTPHTSLDPICSNTANFPKFSHDEIELNLKIQTPQKFTPYPDSLLSSDTNVNLEKTFGTNNPSNDSENKCSDISTKFLKRLRETPPDEVGGRLLEDSILTHFNHPIEVWSDVLGNMRPVDSLCIYSDEELIKNFFGNGEWKGNFVGLNVKRNRKGGFGRGMCNVDSGARIDEVGLAGKVEDFGMGDDDEKVREEGSFGDGKSTGENLQKLYRQIGPKPCIAREEYVRGGGVALVRKSLNNNLTFDGKKSDQGNLGVDRSISLESAGFRHTSPGQPPHLTPPTNFTSIKEKYSSKTHALQLIGIPINPHYHSSQNPNKTYSYHPPTPDPKNPNNNSSEQNQLSARHHQPNSLSKSKKKSNNKFHIRNLVNEYQKTGAENPELFTKLSLPDLLIKRVAECERRVDKITCEKNDRKGSMTPSGCKLKRYTELGSGRKAGYGGEGGGQGVGEGGGGGEGEGKGGVDVGYLGITRNCMRDSYINPDQFVTDRFDTDSAI
jgi:hypothetical protein